MKDYFVHLFQYNDWANRRILQAIAGLDDREEALYLFTHLIVCQHRWLERVRGESTVERSWFAPAYDLASCEREWAASLQAWFDALDEIGDAGLARVLHYETSEGPWCRSTVQEIALQLNFHSVHHRAQIARIIRGQGHVPPETDYIFFTRQDT